MLRQLTFLVLLSLLLVPSVCAVDLFVNDQKGKDENSGARDIATGPDGPLKTIKRALEVCKPGDVIHLAKTDTPYHQDIEIRDGLSGTRERPIIIDGHGATLSGCTMIRADEWTHIGGGLYRNDKLLADIFPRVKPVNEPLLWRFFFLFDGKISRMGKSGKSEHPPLPKPGDLRPGEWTYDQDEMAFFVKIDASKKLADARIEYPDLINGLKTSDGKCEHIIVRNLTVTHFHNDGFNINGATKHFRLENVQAIECGDDGISAHTDSEIVVDGLISRGNSTGFCHVQGGSSVTRRVELRDNHAFEILLTGWGKHELSECLIRPNNGQVRAVRVTSEGADAGKRCSMRMDRVLIDADGAGESKSRADSNTQKRPMLEVLGGCDLNLQKVKLTSVDLQTRWPGGGQGSVSIFDSVITGKFPPRIDLLPDTKWEADRNLYRLSDLTVSGKRYEQTGWKDYLKTTGQDAHSVWTPGAP